MSNTNFWSANKSNSKKLDCHEVDTEFINADEVEIEEDLLFKEEKIQNLINRLSDIRSNDRVKKRYLPLLENQHYTHLIVNNNLEIDMIQQTAQTTTEEIVYNDDDFINTDQDVLISNIQNFKYHLLNMIYQDDIQDAAYQYSNDVYLFNTNFYNIIHRLIIKNQGLVRETDFIKCTVKDENDNIIYENENIKRSSLIEINLNHNYDVTKYKIEFSPRISIDLANSFYYVEHNLANENKAKIEMLVNSYVNNLSYILYALKAITLDDTITIQKIEIIKEKVKSNSADLDALLADFNSLKSDYNRKQKQPIDGQPPDGEGDVYVRKIIYDKNNIRINDGFDNVANQLSDIRKKLKEVENNKGGSLLSIATSLAQILVDEAELKKQFLILANNILELSDTVASLGNDIVKLKKAEKDNQERLKNIETKLIKIEDDVQYNRTKIFEFFQLYIDLSNQAFKKVYDYIYEQNDIIYKNIDKLRNEDEIIKDRLKFIENRIKNNEINISVDINNTEFTEFKNKVIKDQNYNEVRLKYLLDLYNDNTKFNYLWGKIDDLLKLVHLLNEKNYEDHDKIRKEIKETNNKIDHTKDELENTDKLIFKFIEALRDLQNDKIEDNKIYIDFIIKYIFNNISKDIENLNKKHDQDITDLFYNLRNDIRDEVDELKKENNRLLEIIYNKKNEDNIYESLDNDELPRRARVDEERNHDDSLFSSNRKYERDDTRQFRELSKAKPTKEHREDNYKRSIKSTGNDRNDIFTKKRTTKKQSLSKYRRNEPKRYRSSRDGYIKSTINKEKLRREIQSEAIITTKYKNNDIGKEYVKKIEYKDDTQNYIKKNNYDNDFKEYIKKNNYDNNFKEYIKKNNYDNNFKEYIKKINYSNDFKDYIKNIMFENKEILYTDKKEYGDEDIKMVHKDLDTGKENIIDVKKRTYGDGSTIKYLNYLITIPAGGGDKEFISPVNVDYRKVLADVYYVKQNHAFSSESLWFIDVVGNSYGQSFFPDETTTRQEPYLFVKSNVTGIIKWTIIYEE